MNIQKEFENRVKVCCEERVYANAAPAGAQTPYLTYFRQSATPATLDMDGGSVSTRTLLQVDSCGSTYDEAVTRCVSETGIIPIMKSRPPGYSGSGNSGFLS